LLFPLRDSPELHAFYAEYLGALESYDARHGTELIRTLEGFFAHHGNHVRAADALHLHRNTLLYRLARIQSISGLDLDDAEVRLAVQVALRLRPLAGVVPGGAPELPASGEDGAAASAVAGGPLTNAELGQTATVETNGGLGERRLTVGAGGRRAGRG
jgi:hypothetical protein